jgi:hypothetical protein
MFVGLNSRLKGTSHQPDSFAATWRHDDGGMRANRRVCLDHLQEMRALGDGVLPGEDNFNVDAQFRSTRPGWGRLVQLVVVLFCNRRKQGTAIWPWGTSSPGDHAQVEQTLAGNAAALCQ